MCSGRPHVACIATRGRAVCEAGKLTPEQSDNPTSASSKKHLTENTVSKKNTLPAKDLPSPKTSGGREMSAALENYLEIIFRLEMREGAARAGAIAEAAGVSRSTVTSTLKVLKDMGLVNYEPYSLIHLTDRGLVIGRDVAHRHFVFQEFLENVLQIDAAAADETACMLEHVVPQDVIKRLGQFVLYLKSRQPLWEDWQEVYKKEGLANHTHGDAAKVDDPRARRAQHGGGNPYK